jgi:hypothetical protein
MKIYSERYISYLGRDIHIYIFSVSGCGPVSQSPLAEPSTQSSTGSVKVKRGYIGFLL